MSTLSLEIDGREVQVREGMTLLQAAQQAGVRIPTLCQDNDLGSPGDCRLCMVQIEQQGRRRLVASCCYPVKQGLKVDTCTPRVQRLRRLIVELLWPTAQHLGPEVGLKRSRFESSMGDCNQCGLCVRYCREVAKKNAVHFQGRGILRHLVMTSGMEDACDTCGECFSLCSGGWIASDHAEWEPDL